MNCKCCGADLPGDSIFCPYCGTPVGSSSAPAPVPAPEAPPAPIPAPEPAPIPTPAPIPEIALPVVEAPAPAAQVFCSCCGTPMASESRFCPVCGQANAPVPTVEPPVYVNPGPEAPVKKKKKSGALKIVLPIIAGVLVIGLLIGWLTNWFGFYGPAAKILKAAEKTLKAENFTVEITSSYDYDNGEYSNTSTMVYEVSINFDDEELVIVGMNEDDEIEMAIYEGYAIYYYDYSYGNGYYTLDVSDGIEQLFDAYEATGDFDLEDFLKDYNEDFYDEVDDMMDIDQLEKDIKSIFRKLNSNSWLKENAGYSKERVNGVTVYTFEPDIYDFTCAIMEEVEDSFEDEDDYEDMMDELKEERSDMRDTDLTISVGIKSGKLASFEYSTETENYSRSTEMTFSNIGNTNVDTDVLEDILAEAERW